MVSFLAAFGWNCFDTTNIPTRIIMGAAWAALAILVAWCVWMGWVKQSSDSESRSGEDASGAAAEDAQSHRSRSGTGTPRASLVELEVITPEAATGNSGNANQSTVGEMTKFKFWRSWPFFHDRRTSVDSQRTVVNPV